MTAAAMTVAAWTWPQAAESLRLLGGDDFPGALLGVGVLSLVGISGWVLLVVGAGLLQLRAPGVPRMVVGLLFTGVAITGTWLPAQADRSHDLDGLPLPDRPTVTAAAPAGSAVSRSDGDGVLVRPGDSLWHLAAAALPPGSTDADIAGAVGRWYRANRHVIGTDPDLIRPGQVLFAPIDAVGADR